MNLKTTIFLLVLAGVGAGGWFWFTQRQPDPAVSPTLAFLDNQLKPYQFRRIEVEGGFVLERPNGQKNWVLVEKHDTAKSGKWPELRTKEVETLVQTLANLRSRFAAEELSDPPNLEKFGLDRKPLRLLLTIDNTTYALSLAESPDPSQPRFSRPTYLRLDNNKEVVRLAPGLIAAFDRKEEHFRQRRLFPSERIAKDDEGLDKITQLKAEEITVAKAQPSADKSKKFDEDVVYRLVKKAGDWELAEPSRDHVDPDKLSSLFTALLDIWAEEFVSVKDSRTPADFGLETPPWIVTVSRPGASPVKLFVGDVSRSKERKEKIPGPPGPFGPQMKEISVREPYRYAKLADHFLIFEIKADKWNEQIALEASPLRDAQIARFKSDDARRVEIRQGGQTAVLLDKDKDKWRLDAKTGPLDAEAREVSELIDKLADLRVKDRDKDILDKADPKQLGLDPPLAVVNLDLEETKGKGEKKTASKRTLTYHVGQDPKDKTKLYVRLEGWPRVNAVEDNLLKLVQRPALAYRSKRLLDAAASMLAKIEITKGGDSFTLEQTAGAWRLGGPASGEADSAKVSPLAGDLTRLEAVEFIADKSKAELVSAALAGGYSIWAVVAAVVAAENVDRTHGLAKPALQAKLVFTDGKSHTLLLGNARKDKQEYYAQLDKGPVFVVKKDLRESLDRTAYDFVDKTLAKLNTRDIAKVRSTMAAPFTLEQGKTKDWQVIEPAPAFAAEDEAVHKALRPWANLVAVKIVAYGPKIKWADFGLDTKDKPATITVTLNSDGDKDKLGKTTEHVLALGKPVGTGGDRYARLDKQDAVAVLSAATVRELTVSHLDFVNHDVLKFAFDAVASLERKMPGADLSLTKKDEQWLVNGKNADERTVDELLQQTFRLRAKRIAAYPVKDPKEFGLDKPAAEWTIRLSDPKDPKGKPKSHVIKIGGVVLDADKKESGERYAQVDNGPAIAVLAADLSKALVASPLYFADRNLASFAFADKVVVRHKGREATFERVDGNWHMTAPIRSEAEDSDLEAVVKEIKRLRVDELVAEKADLSKYGLAAPQAQWRFFTGEKETLNLQVGQAEPGKEKSPRHYAKLASKDVVFLLGGETSGRLLDEYRRRKPWPSLDAAGVEKLVYKGANGFTLVKKDGAWHLEGKAETKIHEKAITDTLDALRGLKAQRFVADAKADMKLFGLQPPAWTIEAHTDSLKRTLLIGGTEGESKRHYATTPGSDAVFIISEDDAGRIVRPASGFLEDKKAKQK